MAQELKIDIEKIIGEIKSLIEEIIGKITKSTKGEDWNPLVPNFVEMFVELWFKAIRKQGLLTAT